MKLKHLLWTLPALAIAGHVAAQEQNKRFTFELSAEIESDYRFKSDDPDDEFTDTYATIEAALGYALTDSFEIGSSLVFEPVEDATGNRFFEDQGLYVEELFLAYDFGSFGIKAGKFNPTFGLAWDAAPGIYGVEYGEIYEITEKVGVQAVVPLAFAAGEHELELSVFQADRSFLSQSLGTNRGQLDLSDGGVSNTDGLESVALSLSGGFGDTDYTIGLQNQAAGEGDAEDQKGAVIGLAHILNSGGAMPVKLMGEVAYFDTFDGTDESSTITTIGAAIPVGIVTLSAAYSQQTFDEADTDHATSVTAEVPLGEALSVALAYRNGKEGGLKNETLGFLMAYEF